MAKIIDSDFFLKNLMAFLEETFDRVEGIYLDRGTSLFETLQNLSAQQVSLPIAPGGTTIAAHTEHIRFYLRVIADFMRAKSYEKIDWRDSWKIQIVTEPQWRELLRQLRDAHRDVVSVIKGFDNWNEEHRLGGALAVVAHTAYHLGAIRQILRAIKTS
ncbi:conserved hypothetical protein [Candidatus Zixiibacteriota bacterium]|nr:conserved hypothetical protein [candidate division Zixibacteria bacterium]